MKRLTNRHSDHLSNCVYDLCTFPKGFKEINGKGWLCRRFCLWPWGQVCGFLCAWRGQTQAAKQGPMTGHPGAPTLLP